MPHLEILILEFLPINTSATRSVVVGEIASLDHEIRNQTVESRILVGERGVRTKAERKEVVAGFGHYGGEQFEFHVHYFLGGISGKGGLIIMCFIINWFIYYFWV